MPLFTNAELEPGDVVEICGDEGTGKSKLLLTVAAACLLPSTYCGRALPGRGVDALFITTECKLVRLAATMESILSSHGVPSTQCEGVVTSSLEHLHVVRCCSMEELVITLYSLKAFLRAHPEVCIMLLDDLTTLWWTEKALNPTSDVVQRRFVSVLSELISEFHLVVVATRLLLAKDWTATREKVINRLIWYWEFTILP